MLCTRCGGMLYLDSRSVSDLSFSGYSGGRYFCLMGCADTWIRELEVEPKQPMPTERAELRKGEHHTIRHIICADCHQTTDTLGSYTKRCLPCRTARHRENERERARRTRLRHHAAVA